MSQLYFIHHSSYLWVGTDAMILWDYYGKGEVASLLAQYSEKRLYIMATHSHGDHYSPVLFSPQFAQHRGGVQYIFHRELEEVVAREEVVFLETEEEWTDGVVRVKALGSTDCGGSFYVEVHGLQLFHAGDLNNWHWNEEADEEYVELYEAQWQRELRRLTTSIEALDLLMFPTDLRLGRDYLKGLRELLAVVTVKYLAPMHLNGTLAPEELEALCRAHGITLLLPQTSVASVLV